MDLVKHIDDSIEWGELEVSKLTQDILDIHGITSNKVRSFSITFATLIMQHILRLVYFEGPHSVPPFMVITFTQSL